jgi:Ca2+-dependent lipid-binding protein
MQIKQTITDLLAFVIDNGNVKSEISSYWKPIDNAAAAHKYREAWKRIQIRAKNRSNENTPLMKTSN